MPSPDPLRLRRFLGVQGLGFALLLFMAFAEPAYSGISRARAADRGAATRQLAAACAAQLTAQLY